MRGMRGGRGDEAKPAAAWFGVGEGPWMGVVREVQRWMRHGWARGVLDGGKGSRGRWTLVLWCGGCPSRSVRRACDTLERGSEGALLRYRCG